MIKKILLSLCLIHILFTVNAQYVTIPDEYFRNYLDLHYSSCFNGSEQMDTTCPAILNATAINVSSSNITNLTGIQYLKNLDTLECSNNRLTSLPPLPNSLLVLECYQNQLDSLPSLPNSLLVLDCGENQLDSLPSLPNSLIFLACENNPLTSLPPLPNSLKSLLCPLNSLTSLPTLPDSLSYLDCSFNQLTSMPALPDSLSYLDCSGNQLTNLPSLPNSLTTLLCFRNQLTSLPTLPDSLTELECDGNQLTNLPTLPTLLWELTCTSNKLYCLPTLPTQLSELEATGNHIACLPNIPDRLLAPNGSMDSTWQVCDSANNKYNCPVVQQVAGVTNLITTTDQLLFPNPSTGIVSFTQGQLATANISITSTSGTVVFSQNAVNLSSASFDLSNLPKGLYFVQINSGLGIVTQKLALE